jgi:hypothetical protein
LRAYYFDKSEMQIFGEKRINENKRCGRCHTSYFTRKHMKNKKQKNKLCQTPKELKAI